MTSVAMLTRDRSTVALNSSADATQEIEIGQLHSRRPAAPVHETLLSPMSYRMRVVQPEFVNGSIGCSMLSG